MPTEYELNRNLHAIQVMNQEVAKRVEQIDTLKRSVEKWKERIKELELEASCLNNTIKILKEDNTSQP